MNPETAGAPAAPRPFQVWAGTTAPAVCLGSASDREQATRLLRDDIAACPNDLGQDGKVHRRGWWIVPALAGVLDEVPLDGTSADPARKASRTKLPFYLRVRLTIRQEDSKDGKRRRGERRVVERGPWAPPPAPPKGWTKLLERVEVLRKAADGTNVRELGMSPRTAQKLVTMLSDGRAWWGNRSQKVKPAKVRLERDGKDLIVRKGA